MTEAIGTQKTSLPSSVIQALLATSPKFAMPGQVIQRSQIALLEQRQRSIERPAGDQVTSGAAFQLGIQNAVVFCWGGRGESDFDVRDTSLRKPG